jgi:hypothetical protein
VAAVRLHGNTADRLRALLDHRAKVDGVARFRRARESQRFFAAALPPLRPAALC